MSDLEQENELSFKDLFDAFPDAHLLVEAGRIVACNMSACRVLGFSSKEELLSCTPAGISGAYPPDGRRSEDKVRELTDQVLREGSVRLEWVCRRCNGEEFPVELVATRIPQEGRELFYVVFHEITERKRTEDTLKADQAFLRKVIDAVPGYIGVKNREGVYQLANREIARSYGTTVEELVGKRDADFIDDPEAVEKFLADDREVIDHRREKVIPEEKLTDPEGKVQWLSTVKVPLVDEEGNCSQVLLVVTYINELKRAEAALKASETKYRQLHESLRDAVVSVDMDGRILEFNEVYRTMLGYEPEELRSLTYMDLTPEKWHAVEKDITEKQILTRGYSEIYEKEYRRKDGTVFPVELRSLLLRDDSGAPTGMWAIVRDITERKQVEEALRTTQFAMDHATECIMWLDEASRFTYVNHAACRDLGYSREELLGLTVSDIDPDVSEDRYVDIRQRIRAVEFETFETRHRTKDGRIFPVEVSVYIFNYGGKEYSCTFSRDITQRKLDQAAMKKANEELEVRVRERTAELIRSNEELARFAHVASHDLQEPLRMVASYCQLLEMRYKDRLDEDGREFIGYAVEGAQRMQCLIRDLLSYSQVNIHGHAFEPVAVEMVVANVLQCLKIVLEESGGRVTWDPLPEVRGDKIQLLQVFQNLIENGLKFRRQGVRPEIHISAQPQGGEWVFGVRDNGIGIEPQYFERIFVIFQRLHSRKKFPGTGMGLALVKRIVERHGGRVWVESKAGAGTTVYFTLPG